MPYSHQQIALLQQGELYALALKNDPSSRKRATLDRRRKDVIFFEMLGDELILVKLKGDENEHYWTLFDTKGNI